MSVVLWLSGTFYISPYFLASNTAYAVLWLTYLLLMIGNRRMPTTNFQRRNVIRTSIVAALAVVASLAGRSVASSTSLKSASTPGKKIVKLAKLPVGKSFNFIHSAQGVPSVLFRTKSGVFAYSAICTHQGCTVTYKASTKKLTCPCHGAQFDPFANGSVTTGPAETPLAKVKVKVNRGWVVES
jgi:thiosulfate dehydrogenase [quinone] large subunit